MKILCFDLETTGTNALLHGVHQIGGIIIELTESRGIVIKSKFQMNVHPHKDVEIDPEALKVSGLTPRGLKGYPSPTRVFQKFHDILVKHMDDPRDKYTLMGYYNLHLDNDFLRNWWDQSKPRSNTSLFGFNQFFYTGSIDVSALAANYLLDKRAEMPNFKLATVAKTLGIEIPQGKLHEALTDALLTLQIYQKVR